MDISMKIARMIFIMQSLGTEMKEICWNRLIKNTPILRSLQKGLNSEHNYETILCALHDTAAFRNEVHMGSNFTYHNNFYAEKYLENICFLLWLNVLTCKRPCTCQHRLICHVIFNNSYVDYIWTDQCWLVVSAAIIVDSYQIDHLVTPDIENPLTIFNAGVLQNNDYVAKLFGFICHDILPGVRELKYHLFISMFYVTKLLTGGSL